jgi:hypothetical protein
MWILHESRMRKSSVFSSVPDSLQGLSSNLHHNFGSYVFKTYFTDEETEAQSVSFFIFVEIGSH